MEMREKYVARLINDPKRFGFTEVKMINAPQIMTARWVRQRCWYLCLNPNADNTVPPGTPTGDETQLLLDEYKFGVMIRQDIGFPFPVDFQPVWLEFQEALVAVENESFKRGYGKAFAAGCGNCLSGHHDDSLRPCSFPGKKRPTLEAVGVNLYDTLNLIGWDEYLVRDAHQPFHLFGLLLLE
jgi:predicted metal-binding protein